MFWMLFMYIFCEFTPCWPFIFNFFVLLFARKCLSLAFKQVFYRQNEFVDTPTSWSTGIEQRRCFWFLKLRQKWMFECFTVWWWLSTFVTTVEHFTSVVYVWHPCKARSVCEPIRNVLQHFLWAGWNESSSLCWIQTLGGFLLLQDNLFLLLYFPLQEFPRHHFIFYCRSTYTNFLCRSSQCKESVLTCRFGRNLIMWNRKPYRRNPDFKCCQLTSDVIVCFFFLFRHNVKDTKLKGFQLYIHLVLLIYFKEIKLYKADVFSASCLHSGRQFSSLHVEANPSTRISGLLLRFVWNLFWLMSGPQLASCTAVTHSYLLRI